MSPRPGGEADKLGNRYEAVWTIRHALYCIQDASHALTVEDPRSELGKGAEFTYESAGAVEVHQVKRQNGTSNSWSVKSLADRGVLAAAAHHVRAGRKFHFASLVPCIPLNELADRARRSPDIEAFSQNWLTGDLRSIFDQLATPEIFGSERRTWEILRGITLGVYDERDLVRSNATIAASQLSGDSGPAIALTIGEIVLDNLGKRLTQVDLLEHLNRRGISLAGAEARQSARDQVDAATASWSASVERELLEPRIGRSEAGHLIEKLRSNRVGFVVGGAGGGKSSAVLQATELLSSTGAAVLAFRLDRLDSFTSTADLGKRLGLEQSPATTLARAANDKPGFLVIDQLDAVSLASGRMPERFDVVADIVREAMSIPNLSVVLVCREFDLANDHRIRALADNAAAGTVKVGLLTNDAVETAVADMDIDVTSLSASQKEILRSPLHLVLLRSIVDRSGLVKFHSRGSLFDAFWERKRQTARLRRHDVRFDKVISRVANVASERQSLSIPAEALDQDDLVEDANVLISEHVLARDGFAVAFFHETFFDYAFARQWVWKSESLVVFLMKDEQELFRRAQIRQILQHLAERDADRFRHEVAAVLTDDRVRFHIKKAALTVLSGLIAPSDEDATTLLQIARDAPDIADHIWVDTCRSPWFTLFYNDGRLATWLDSEDLTLQARAVNLMRVGVGEYPAEVAGMLSSRRFHPQYKDWVRSVAGRVDAHRSRELFNLVLDSTRAGSFDENDGELWWLTYDLAQHEPQWAIELLKARIFEHPDSLRLDASGAIPLLDDHQYGASQLIADASHREPHLFVQAAVPYLLEVMAKMANEQRAGNPVYDRQFSHAFGPDHADRTVGDALYSAALKALEALASTDSSVVTDVLERLSRDPHDSAQYLLYRALIAGAESNAQWAAMLLLEGDARLLCGYISDPRWVARELLAAVAPHLDDGTHLELETRLRDLRNPYESPRNSGRAAFAFLSAMDESRLSRVGSRRLAEYRRKFHRSVPLPPKGIVGGAIGSPISPAAAAKMGDDHWIRAMARYDRDASDWDTFTGGSRELSHVLRNEAAADPIRFAQLALRLTPDLNPSYADGVLMGLAEAEHSEEVAPFLYDAIRHIAQLENEENDRWLGGALRRYYSTVPIDVVELILARALTSNDPRDDTPIITRDGDDGRRAADMHMNAINTARGSLAESLGDLLVTDADGTRTELVRPHLAALACDPVDFVRSSVAHVLAGALRHARPQAVAAFDLLIRTDDRVLASGPVRQLMIYIGNVDPGRILPVVERMLSSPYSEVREEGGRLAAYAALGWEHPDLLAAAVSGDAPTRKGVAEVCAARVDVTSNVALATTTLIQLSHDEDPDVRDAVSEVAGNLRDQHLRPFADLIKALIDSPAYESSSPQLLITLEHAPDKIDDLIVLAAKRFLEKFGGAAGDLRTSAAADAHHVSNLVVRGLAQSRDRKTRSDLLDIVDCMLQLGAYGVDESISVFERH